MQKRSEYYLEGYMVRLNKFMADAGVGSRRHCDQLILRGRVTVNGIKVNELGVKVDPTHKVVVDGKTLHAQKLVYWVVNKPKGYLCTNHDPGGRPTVLQLIPHVEERVYTVGRLDDDSEGLLLLTNDGDLALKLTHPSFGITKSYIVLVAGTTTEEELQRMMTGVRLSEGMAKAQYVERIAKQGNATLLRIVLSEGKNREIRRMLAKLGHKVMELRRVSIGPIQIDRLKRGKCRKLSTIELAGLKRLLEGKTGTSRSQARPAAERKPTRPVHPLQSEND
jgi:23S rRNA pseudouridine2605 synthase